jgi:hypothetical protein
VQRGIFVSIKEEVRTEWRKLCDECFIIRKYKSNQIEEYEM